MNFFREFHQKHFYDLSEIPEFILNHYRDNFYFLYGKEKADELIEDTKNRLEKIIEEFKKKGYEDDMIKGEIFATFQNFFAHKKKEKGYFSQEDMKKIYERARKKIEAYIPNPEDFINDPYPREEVLADIAKVKELEKDWEKNEENFFSKTVELVASNYLESWLNSSDYTYYVSVSPTAKPDDYGITNPAFNKGFDFALEFQYQAESEDKIEPEFEFAGATIDITTSEDLGVIREKLRKIIAIIKSGKVPIIKYFENADETYKGKIEVAPFLLITSHETAREILAKFYFDEGKLMNHMIQYSLLEQMKQQTELFIALSREHQNHVLEKKYMMIHNHLNHVIYKKYEEIKGEKIDIEVLKEKFFGTNILMSELSKLAK